MHKVNFLIVPSFSSDDWLDEKMLQITQAFIDILNVGEYPVHTLSSYNEINDYLTSAEFLVVASAGTVIVERDHIYNKMHSIPETVGLIANLLQYDYDTTPYFHEQFFILRTAAFKKLEFNGGKDQGFNLIRSYEDMHDGHAPLYITLGGKTVDRDLKFGTRIIEECLKNNFEVRNWDQEWRYPKTANDYLKDVVLPSRGFLYPKKSTEAFAEALKKIELVEGLDDSQELFIKIIQQVLKFNVLNGWQYEFAPSVPAKKVICPATGFLGELCAVNSGAKKIVLYDKNLHNLNFKKKLYTEWDGNDYDSFMQDYAKTCNLPIEPTFDIDIKNSVDTRDLVREKILANWKEFKQSVTVEFIDCDIIKDFSKLETHFEENTLLGTSTILTVYPFTHVIYSKEEIISTREKIQRLLDSTNSVWFEMPFNLNHSSNLVA